MIIERGVRMLQMIEGCRIHDPSVLNEGYSAMKYGFAANVNADKILPVVESFVRLHNEYCFLILEVPTNLQDETDPSVRHKDVYYLDGLTPEMATQLLQAIGKILVHDGLSTFGIGIHSGANEILVGKYNVVTIYTKTPNQYKGFFENHKIPYVSNLKTAWDYFTQETPGDSVSYSYKGKDVYDLVEYLKQHGLYLAERREEA